MEKRVLVLYDCKHPNPVMITERQFYLNPIEMITETLGHPHNFEYKLKPVYFDDLDTVELEEAWYTVCGPVPDPMSDSRQVFLEAFNYLWEECGDYVFG